MVTHREFYGTIASFFLALGFAKLLRLFPFYGNFLIVLLLIASFALVPSKDSDGFRIVPIGSALGFFLELYLVQLNFMQEAFEFLTIGILATVLLMVNSGK